MSAGLLVLVVTITCMARNRALPKFVHKLMIAGNIAALTYLSLVFAMRWIIGALITMLIYATALHSRSLRYFNRPVFFHGFAMLAFLSVLFTYFGVNYFLGGLHSYGAA